MEKRRKWSWAVITSLMAALSLSIVLSVQINYGFDAMIYTEMALKYADTWAFFSPEFHDQSPPLRYVPYAIIMAVVDPPSYNLAFRLATMYAAIITFAGGGLASYELGRLWEDTRSHLFGLVCVGLFLGTVFVWPKNRFFVGKWQYTTTFPFIIAALIMARQTLYLSDDSRRRWALATGVLLGLIGLQQLTAAAFASITVGLTYFVYRRWQALFLTGFTGAAFGSLLFVSQSEAQSRAVNAIGSKFFPESGTIAIDVAKLTNIGVLAIIFGLGITVLLAWRIPNRRPETTIVDLMVVVLAISWAASSLTTAVDYLAVVTLYPLIFFSAVATSGRLFSLINRFEMERVVKSAG